MTKITTPKNWDDILPAASVQELLKTLHEYRQNAEAVPCLVLFYGAATEHKPAAAALAADELKKEVYGISLPAVVSKYIGETEKNLVVLFDEAAKANRILFFDEADALFEKRTAIKDSHDKYSDADAEHLLQAIQKYPHPVIVAVSDKTKIASSILRSFHAVVHFPATNKE